MVVSAMPRTHPDCLNYILTGYPAFESALEALRHKIDDYFINPADLGYVSDMWSLSDSEILVLDIGLQNSRHRHRCWKKTKTTR